MFFTVNLFDNQTNETMARPITETPVLTGQDAIRFIERANNPLKATLEEKRAVRDAYQKFKLMSKEPNIF